MRDKPMRVYIVTAEANGVPQTFDGQWFHILGVFYVYETAYAFLRQAVESGEWGEYEDGDEDRPLDSSDWQINLYDEEVLAEMKIVPKGYKRS